MNDLLAAPISYATFCLVVSLVATLLTLAVLSVAGRVRKLELRSSSWQQAPDDDEVDG